MNQDLLNRLRSRAGTADESDARLLMEAAAEIRKGGTAKSEIIDFIEREQKDHRREYEYAILQHEDATDILKLHLFGAMEAYKRCLRLFKEQSNLSPRDPEHLDPYGPGNGPLADEDVFRLRDDDRVK